MTDAPAAMTRQALLDLAARQAERIALEGIMREEIRMLRAENEKLRAGQQAAVDAELAMVVVWLEAGSRALERVASQPFVQADETAFAVTEASAQQMTVLANAIAARTHREPSQ